MNRKSRLPGYSLMLLTMVVMVSGCIEERVLIPPLGQDRAPVITIHTLASGGPSAGKIERPEAISQQDPGWLGFTRTIGRVSSSMKLVITGEATNKIGGTKDFSIRVTAFPIQGDPKEIVVTKEGNVVNNEALETLIILSKDGDPIIVDTTGLYMVSIFAEASNYNSMRTGLEVLHYPVEW